MPAKKKKSAADKPNEEKTLQAATPSATHPPPDDQRPFHIVGIGASAGGLEALKGFFEEMPKVTRFFRDRKAFDVLLKKGLQPLLRQKETGSVVRIWIPACATGEEAYSFAIMAIEASEALEKFFEFKIFATDINSAAVAAAHDPFEL
jgi:two-component system CheB/CheR fusion protein